MARYDRSVPLMSLLYKLEQHGVTVVAVNDGEEIIEIKAATPLETRKAACEAILAVDHAGVGIQYHDGSGNAHRTDLQINFWDEASTILSDWYIPEYEDFARIIQEVARDHHKLWSGNMIPWEHYEQMFAS